MGWFPLFAPAETSDFAFNGGKVQTQSAFLYSPGDYPYINYMKKAADWTYTHNGQSVIPSDLSVKGYPTTMTNGQYQCVVPKPTQASIGSPNWVLRWSGNAQLFIDSATTVSGSLIGGGGSGYYEFSTTEDAFFRIGVADLKGSFVDDIELYRKDQESNRNAGEKWNPRHISLLKDAKISVLRYLDYQYGNTTNVTTYASRKPTDYFSHAATEYRPSLTIASVSYTANSGTDYAFTGNGTGVPATGGPTSRMMVHVKLPITNTCPSNIVTTTNSSANFGWASHPLVVGDIIQLTYGGFPGTFSDGTIQNPSQSLYVVSTTTDTFQVSKTSGGSALTIQTQPGFGPFATRPATVNMNSAGKIALADFSGSPFQSNQISDTNWVTLIYDAELNKWLLAAFSAHGIINGMPVEDMIDLAKTVGAHPHFISPYLSVFPAGDWHSGVATYAQANAPSWVIPRFEGLNETFNTFGGFVSGPHQLNVARTLWGFAFDTQHIYGRSIRILSQQVGAVYGAGNIETKFDILIGVQSSTGIDTDSDGPMYRNPSAARNTNPRATSELADGYKVVNLNTSGATVTMLSGGVHGKSIGDPISFYANSNSLPSNVSNFQKFWVANNANFSTTAFDITTVSGGGSFGQVGTAPGSGGAGPYFMHDATQVQPSSIASEVVQTNYINPASQNSIKEMTDAINYYVNDDSTQKADRIRSYVTNCTVTSATIVGSISGTTLHVASVTSGDLLRRDSAILGAGVADDTYLVAKIATQGADVATFTVNNSQTVASTAMRLSPLKNYYQAWKYWGANLPFPITKSAGYEGGWSPDYVSPGPTANLDSAVTAISKASSAVFTLSDTNMFNNFAAGKNPAVVGGYFQITGLASPYDIYNGRVVSITGVSGTQVTTNLDTSSQAAAYTGSGRVYFLILKGTATGSITGTVLTISGTQPRMFDYVSYGNNSAQISSGQSGAWNLYGSPTATSSTSMNVFTSGINFINDWRAASKNVPELKDVTLQNFIDFTTIAGFHYPSVYFFAGGSVWGNWDPDYYQVTTAPVLWQAVLDFQEMA